MAGKITLRRSKRRGVLLRSDPGQPRSQLLCGRDRCGVVRFSTAAVLKERRDLHCLDRTVETDDDGGLKDARNCRHSDLVGDFDFNRLRDFPIQFPGGKPDRSPLYVAPKAARQDICRK